MPTIWVAVKLYSIVNMVAELMDNATNERTLNLTISKSSFTPTIKHGLHSKYKEEKPSLLEGRGTQIRFFYEFSLKTNDLQPVREEMEMDEGISSKC